MGSSDVVQMVRRSCVRRACRSMVRGRRRRALKFGGAWTTPGPAKRQKIIVEPFTTPMSLYYEAAAVLANSTKAGGSLKSRIYNQKDLKSSPAQIVALVTEASKWSPVLKHVIEQSGLLGEERKVCYVSNMQSASR